jgi:hypothetical protein
MDEDNRAIPLGVWIFWIAIVTIVGISVAANLLKGNPDRWTYIQTVVNALALLAVAWTAVLALRTRQAMIRQTNVTILPVFVVFVGRSRSSNPNSQRMLDELEIENIGNGVALNVHIDDINIDIGFTAPTMGITEPNITFETLTSIPAKTTAIVRHISWADKSRSEGSNITNHMDWLWHITPQRASKDYDLKIRFMDILGNSYVQTIHAGKSGVWPDIVEPDTRSQFRPKLINDNSFTSSPMMYVRRRIP